MSKESYKKQFEGVKPKPPQQIPYEPKKHPKELEEVEGHKDVKVRFAFRDYMRLLYLYLLEGGKGLLPHEEEKVRNVCSYLTIGLAVVVIVLLFMLVLR